MDVFITAIGQHADIIVSALVALIIAFITYLKTRIDNKRLSERMDNIVDILHNEEERYYVKCPKCNNKILLMDVEILREKQNKK